MSRRPLLLVLPIVLGLASCSAATDSGADKPKASTVAGAPGSGRPAVPAGWTTTNGSHFSFAHPAGWTITRSTDQGGAPVIVVNGPAGAGGLSRQIIAASKAGVTVSLATVIQGFAPVRELPEQVVVRDLAVTIPGAKEAQLTERTWKAPVASGSPVPARVLELRLITPGKEAVDFLVRCSEADFASSGLAAVFASLRLS